VSNPVATLLCVLSSISHCFSNTLSLYALINEEKIHRCAKQGAFFFQSKDNARKGKSEASDV